MAKSDAAVVLTGCPALLLAASVAISYPFAIEYDFYWLTGAWLPWFVPVLLTLYVLMLCVLRARNPDAKVKRFWIGAAPNYIWIILWLAHYAPQMKWPVLH